MRASLLAALCAATAAGQTSPSAAPTSIAPVCDAVGTCYAAITRGLSFSDAVTACSDLGNGWHLASIVDEATGAALTQGSQGSCGGALPADTFYWVGLYDLRNQPGYRIPNRSNQSYTGWGWANAGDDMSFFLSTQSQWWVPGEPDQWQGGQFCVNLWPGHNHLLDDVGCGAAIAACCQRYAPSPSASQTATATSSLSPGASASASANVSGTASTTASGSVSAWAPATGASAGTVVGGLIAAAAAAVAAAALIALAIAIFSATAIWRRRQARRGGALVSPTRLLNSMKSTRMRAAGMGGGSGGGGGGAVEAAASIATRNPLEMAAAYDDGRAPVTRASSALRFAAL